MAPKKLVFTPSGCIATSVSGRSFKVDLPETNLEQALSWIKWLNEARTEDGRRLPSLVTEDGYEMWWFVQDRLFTRFLVPYTRYERVVSWALEGATVVDPPPDLEPLLRILTRASESVTVVHRAPKNILRSWRRWLGTPLVAMAVVASWLAAWWFRARGRAVAVYTVDIVSPGLRHDFRIDPIYRELERRELSYGEFVHSLGGVGAVQNFFRRRRLSIDMQAMAMLETHPAVNMSPAASIRAGDMPVDRAQFFCALAREGCRASSEAVRKYRALRRLVRLHRPRFALVFDDSRHTNELVAACRSEGVYVVNYQHGLAFNRYFVGLMAYGFLDGKPHRANAYGLWSDYFRQRLLRDSRLYDASTTFVCGMLRSPGLDVEAKDLSSEGRVRVLVVSESQGRTEEIVPFVAQLVDREAYEVILKLRPGEQAPTPWRPLLELGLGTSKQSVYDAVRDCDVVLGTYSSVLYEAAFLLKPLVVVKTTAPVGDELVQESLAELASGPDGIEQAVTRAVALPTSELERRRAVLWGDGRVDGARHLVEHALARSTASTDRS